MSPICSPAQGHAQSTKMSRGRPTASRRPIRAMRTTPTIHGHDDGRCSAGNSDRIGLGKPEPGPDWRRRLHRNSLGSIGRDCAQRNGRYLRWGRWFLHRHTQRIVYRNVLDYREHVPNPYTVAATYSGDTNYLGASATTNETVNQCNSHRADLCAPRRARTPLWSITRFMCRPCLLVRQLRREASCSPTVGAALARPA